MKRSKVSTRSNYLRQELETMTGADLRRLQLDRTREILEWAYHRSDFYKDHFARANVKPSDFGRLEDIAKFPYVDKSVLMEDQREHPPYGRRLCVPLHEIRRVNLTSGTSGRGQEVHCHDEGAVVEAAVSTARHFTAIGLGEGDLSAVLHPLGTMTGGMLSHDGLRHIGAVSLPLAVFNTNQKLDVMRQLDLHHIITTPAYLSRVTALCMEQGLTPREGFPRLKGITLSTEPFTVAWAERMEGLWGTVLHDIYGSSQLNLNYAITCEYGAVPDGRLGAYHLTDFSALVEVLDKETGEPARYGEWGEPVVTTFSRRAMPLVRFRSNDRVRVLPPEPCGCGRTSLASWEVGTISRYDDMIKIKATNIWPRTIDQAAFSFDEIEEYAGRVYIEPDGRERAAVSVEFRKTGVDEATKRAILGQLARKIKDTAQVTMSVTEVPHGTLPRYEYKVKRWTDDRAEGMENVEFIEK